MKKKVLFGFFLATTFVLAFSFATPAMGEPELAAGDILNKIDDLFRGDSSKGRMTMSIVNPHWKRSMTMDFWGKGKDKSLIRIRSPKKEEGTSTLRSGGDIWNYLPKVNRVIKLPSSMMSGAWMGSDFTNDDLVKESRMADDYTYKVTFQGEKEGKKIVELTLIPKENAAVVWGKVVATVSRKNYLPTAIRYYGEDMKLARTMNFSEIKMMGGRLLPVKLTLIPENKPGQQTTVVYDKIEFGVAMSDDFFSMRRLKR